MSKELLFVLIGSTALMCGIIALQMGWYGVSKAKSIAVSLVLVVVGVVGSYLWFFVENLQFGGRSFYGSIFFAPLFFWPAAHLLKIRYTHCLDFCTPGGCLTLAAVKIQCLMDGCCQGKILYIDEDHMYVRFPSQITEMIDFLILAVVLFILSKNPKYRGKIFPLFLVLYGATRFVLNCFREETTPYALGLTAGAFWSVCAVVIGLVWLYICKKRVKTNPDDQIDP